MSVFPSAVSTDSDLYIAVNSASTTLTDNPLTIGATTVNVVSTSAFPSVGCISIDSEIIKYTGKTINSFTGCTRGFDGTSASAHVLNSTIYFNVIAAHHNVLKEEIKAIEQNLSDRIGLGSSTLVTNVPTSIKGTITNDSAPSGYVGEYIVSNIASGSAVDFQPANATINLTSISLTAGDWDVSAMVQVYAAGSSAMTVASMGVSSTAGSSGPAGETAETVTTPIANLQQIPIAIPPRRFSLSSTTTIYLAGYATYTGATPRCWGNLSARRVR